MSKIKRKNLLTVIGVFLLITGLALVLTFIFSTIGSSYAKGEYEGFIFSGTIAFFIGLFFVLLRGFKTIYSILIPSIFFLFTSGLLLDSKLTNSMGSSDGIHFFSESPPSTDTGINWWFLTGFLLIIVLIIFFISDKNKVTN